MRRTHTHTHRRAPSSHTHACTCTQAHTLARAWPNTHVPTLAPKHARSMARGMVLLWAQCRWHWALFWATCVVVDDAPLGKVSSRVSGRLPSRAAAFMSKAGPNACPPCVVGSSRWGGRLAFSPLPSAARIPAPLDPSCLRLPTRHAWRVGGVCCCCHSAAPCCGTARKTTLLLWSRVGKPCLAATAHSLCCPMMGASVFFVGSLLTHSATQH